MADITRILSRVENGDPQAAEQLLPLIYDELRQLAADRLAREQPGQTIEATALVHDARIRLVDVDQAQRWDSRGHFFAAAAEAMRRILVDNAIRKKALKRGGDFQRVDFSRIETAVPAPREDILALHEALEELSRDQPQTASLVKLRYFAGLTSNQAAELLQISPRKADSLWAYARVWLHDRISSEDP